MMALLYARVSSQEQANRGYSLQDQLRTLRAYADKHGHEVVEEVGLKMLRSQNSNRPPRIISY